MSDDYKDEIEKLYANYNRDLLKQTYKSTISDERREKIYNYMPQCYGDENQKDWHNCIGSYTWKGQGEILELDEPDKKYTGPWKSGKPHGNGIFETFWYSKERKYKIEKYEGMFNYFERYVGSRQNYFERYEDVINYFEYNGKGSWFRDGDKYEGDWKKGLKHGQGIFIWANGNKYEGDWRFNHFEGTGTFTHSNGSKYNGEWYGGEKHGWGTFTHYDGSVEKGLWKNNEKIK